MRRLAALLLLVTLSAWLHPGLSHTTVKHRLVNARTKLGGRTAQLVGILATRLPEPEGVAPTDERSA